MKQTTENPPTVLVVDDEDVIRFTLQKKLTRMGYKVISLEKAEDVLYLLKNDDVKIDLVITDIKLRKMDGIELLQRIKNLDDPIPVLIITGHGNVEDAIKALRYGASDFIRKPFDINDVASSARSILRSKREKEFSDNFAQYNEYEKSIHKIPVDPTVINPIAYRLTRNLVTTGLCNFITAENITLALIESISNAMFHGNLEISSEIKNVEGIKRFNDEVDKRKNEETYKNRLITINYELTNEYVEYIIEDEGKGFNFNSLPDPRDPENFFKNSGRGLLIIRIHMDEVEWNGHGNIIRLRKYKVKEKIHAKEKV
ncbi:MAG: response regulator [Actinomycetia bacterium]|nr:response regulator [Actinomycetes bacterium]